MRTLRGGLVGLVVGAVNAVIAADAIVRDDDLGAILSNALIFLVPFPLGAAGAALLRIPRWYVVGIAGAIATAVLGAALAKLVPDNYLFGYDEMWTIGVYVVAGVLGFVAAVWWARDWWAGITVTGLLVSTHVISLQVRDPWHEWQEAFAFQRAGIPLVASHLPGHRMRRAELWTGEEEGTAILLEYARPDHTEIRVLLRPASAATPGAACRSPFPAITWGTDGVSCSSSRDDRWVREDSGGDIAVFARRGNALVQADGTGATSQELFALVDTLRPVTAAQLARV
ncbi:hypothetical protein ACIBI9_61210 [Nonomuraea sp. NPDC050451]|uniref:hypothetical protein n=1 Tax=Nonomuraea sp. NPDC050451 TaxID=3364364 RepID=UPI003790C2CB